VSNEGRITAPEPIWGVKYTSIDHLAALFSIKYCIANTE